MKEKSLILFTLLAQAAVGAFWTAGALSLLIGRGAGLALTAESSLLIAFLILAALAASFFHLGAPGSSWRAAAGLRSSWLSREIVAALLFAGGVIGFIVLERLGMGDSPVGIAAALLTALAGLALVYAMSRVYRLRTVPAWDNWVTPAAFLVTTLLLGALATAALLLVSVGPGGVLRGLAVWAGILLAAQLALLPAWLGRMADGEAAQASFKRLTEENGRTLRLRATLAVMALVVLVIALLTWSGERSLVIEIGLWLAFGLALVSEALGRVLFYAARVREGI